MGCAPSFVSLCKTGLMLRLLRLLFLLFTRFFHSRRELLLENLVLRQQLRFQRKASAAETGYGRQDVPTLVGMEAYVGSRTAGDGRSLALHRIQAVLGDTSRNGTQRTLRRIQFT